MFGDGEVLQPIQGEGTDFVWSKVSIPLLFIVQSKFDFEFVYDHDNGFCTLMILLMESDRKYKGGMKHKMIQI